MCQGLGCELGSGLVLILGLGFRDVQILKFWVSVSPQILTKDLHLQQYAIVYPQSVVKVRGKNAGYAILGPLKIAGERSQAPHSH